MQKQTSGIYTAIRLASQSMSLHSAAIAEQMLYYFLQRGSEELSLHELETFCANHRISVNDCFSAMSWLLNTNIIVKKLYDKQTGMPVILPSKHQPSNASTSNANTNISNKRNVNVRWTLNTTL